jgi:hypothetical protein
MAPHEGAQPVDHVARTARLGRHPRQDLLEFGGIHRAGGEQPLAGLGVVRDGRQRLVQFVRDAGGHLAQRAQPGDVREPLALFRRASSSAWTTSVRSRIWLMMSCGLPWRSVMTLRLTSACTVEPSLWMKRFSYLTVSAPASSSLNCRSVSLDIVARRDVADRAGRAARLSV